MGIISLQPNHLIIFCDLAAALLMLKEQQIYLFGQIQTSQTGGQPYSDTSPMLSVLSFLTKTWSTLVDVDEQPYWPCW